MVAEVVGASKTDEQSPNLPPAPPVEMSNTTVINVSEWLVAETITKSSILSYVGVEKTYYKRGEDGSDELGITTGVTDLQFFLSLA